VLLKNEDNVLPLNRQKAQTIALIGPYTDSSLSTIGRWAGINMMSKYVSAVEGIKKAIDGTGVKLLTAKGCGIENRDTTDFAHAAEVARQADVVVLLVGEGDMMSGEAESRTNIQLPGMQRQLVSRIASVEKPTVMVLTNGRPMDISSEADKVDAVVDNWVLGATAGDALADVLFGDYNPSGHLTMTFPRNVGQIPIYYNHQNTGRPIDPDKPFERFRSNYQDSVPNTPLYPFGYGLSYTSFNISNIALDKTAVSNRDSVVVTCDISNTGLRDGATVVQLYIRDLVSCPTRPVAELAGFNRVTLKAGETRRLSFTLRMRDLGFYDDNYQWQLPDGDMLVWVGLHAEDKSNVLKLHVNH
jgi:beta-glucosidase